MKKNPALIIGFVALALSTSNTTGTGQTESKPGKQTVVTAAQVNGTYRSHDSEFRILALGHGKLKVQFDGVYHTISKSVNTGYASGEATIDGNVATLNVPDFAACKINLVFLPKNTMKVIQEGSDADCGFGHNVYATGTYRKIRAGKPKFEEPPE